MFLLDIALIALAGIVCIPVAMFCLEVLVALAPQRRRKLTKSPANGLALSKAAGRIAVLIPAHNEELVLKATLDTLMPTLPAGSRVLVVADNCTDRTAPIARHCGAEVVERLDRDRRGKGFALDFGVRHLAAHPPEAVVILDADCHVRPDTVELLGTTAIATGRPVQGLNLCDVDSQDRGLRTISGFAFRLKNLVRARGLARLAGTCHLTGTGMALPWQLARAVRLTDGNIVEDMQLGIDLALAGHPPLFVPEARVDSPLPQSAAAARSQRQRWEHGHLLTLLVQTPRLMGLAILHRRLSLLCLALDLAIPPLSLLVLMLLAATAGSFLAWWGGAALVPLVMLLIANVALMTAVLLGWAAFCRGLVPFSALVTAPLYAAAKLPIYLAFLGNRQSQWVRTERDARPASRHP